MDPEAEALARRAAERLAAHLGADLPANVEAELQDAASLPQRYDAAMSIALATLVLNIVKFAWDLRKDLRTDPAPDPEVIARRVRLEVALPNRTTTDQRDQVIAVVIDELSRI
jgi:hypothetical protein